MRVLALSSAGKDSTLSLDWALHRGWEVAAIVTVLAQPGSWMFQSSCVDVAKFHADSLEVPWIPVNTPPDLNELDALEQALGNEIRLQQSSKPIGGLVSGAIASDYQKSRIDRIGARLGIPTFSPLWHHDPEIHLRAVCDAGLDARIVHTAAEGLDEHWIGIHLNSESVSQLGELSLSHRLRADGEGGEYETIVLNAPWMKYPIHLEGTTSITNSTSTFTGRLVRWSNDGVVMGHAGSSTDDSE